MDARLCGRGFFCVGGRLIRPCTRISAQGAMSLQAVGKVAPVNKLREPIPPNLGPSNPFFPLMTTQPGIRLRVRIVPEFAPGYWVI